MELIGFVLALLVSGLIIGALARLLVPGPDPMGLGGTILLGIGGALLGGLIGRLLFGPGYVPGLILSVVGAILLLLLFRSGRTRQHA